MRLVLDNLNLVAAERLIVQTALAEAGNIVHAAELLGLTRHAVKRRMIKHNLSYPVAKKEASADAAATTP